MKIIVERDKLKDALPFVVGRTKGASTIPILQHLLIEADKQQLKITGHALDSCSQVTVPAEVTESGAIAMPADRFNRLIAGLPAGSQVSITTDKQIAKVKAGRSVYQFGLLPAEDFPGILQPESPITITLTAKQVARLFKMPAPCICAEKTRIYLHGIYLHLVDRRLAGCATDGHTLLRAFVDLSPPDFAGAIVPDNACDEIVRIAGSDDVVLEISPNLIAAQAADRRYVSKIIDGTFPDYQRVIPQATAAAMTLDAEDLDAALARLIAATDPEVSPAVHLLWDANPGRLTAKLQSKFGEGSEEIDIDCEQREAGDVGAQVEYIRKLVDTLGGETVRFFIGSQEDPIRIENPNDADVVAVLMPCRV